jgi:hypothetical protein
LLEEDWVGEQLYFLVGNYFEAARVVLNFLEVQFVELTYQQF